MTSPRDDVIGLPTFAVSSWESSSLFCFTRAANFERVRPRLPAAHVGPALAILERLLGGGDGPIDVLPATQRCPGDDLAGRRVDDIEGLPVGRVDALAADDHPDGRRLGGVGPGCPLLGGHGEVLVRARASRLGRGKSGRDHTPGEAARSSRSRVALSVRRRLDGDRPRSRPAPVPDTPMRWSAWRASSKATSASGSDSRPRPFRPQLLDLGSAARPGRDHQLRVELASPFGCEPRRERVADRDDEDASAVESGTAEDVRVCRVSEDRGRPEAGHLVEPSAITVDHDAPKATRPDRLDHDPSDSSGAEDDDRQSDVCVLGELELGAGCRRGALDWRRRRRHRPGDRARRSGPRP